MRYARIADGKVAEILPSGVKPEDVFPEEVANTFVECASSTKEGMLFSNGKFTVPPVVIFERSVPVFISPAQGRLVLHRKNLLEAAKTAASGDPEIEIWFEYATIWRRDNTNLNRLGKDALSLTDEMLDAFFIEAEDILE